MIFIILFSFYVGFEFSEYKILPSYYFVEFEKGSFIYGVKGTMDLWEEEVEGILTEKIEEKRVYYSFSLGINTGFKKGLKFKNYKYNLLLLLNPLYEFRKKYTRQIREDSLKNKSYSKYKFYEHRVFSNFMIGIEFPFKIKNLQFKLRLTTPLFTVHYFQSEYKYYYSSGEIEDSKDEKIGIKSELGKGYLSTSILLEIR